jgi:hypothetical protein
MTERDDYRDRPADDHSLSHEDIAREGLSEPSDYMDAPDTGWPDSMVWDLGDGVTATQGELRRPRRGRRRGADDAPVGSRFTAWVRDLRSRSDMSHRAAFEARPSDRRQVVAAKAEPTLASSCEWRRSSRAHSASS